MISSYTIKEEETISDNWGTLKNVVFETVNDKGKRQEHKSEVYDAGNGVAALLYNPASATVLLNRQFRLVTALNGNPMGMMIEVCAGKIDDLSAEETIIKEIWEETGYSVSQVRHVMSIYPSPGALTERLELYLAEYSTDDKKGKGGGLEEEGEDIDVQEVQFAKAMTCLKEGLITDAKTIILLQWAALNGLFSSIRSEA